MVDSVEQKIQNVRKWADKVTVIHTVTDLMKFAGLKISQRKFRKLKEQPRTLTNFFSHAQSILIILPTEYNAAIAAGKSLQSLEAELSTMNVTYVDFLNLPRTKQEFAFYETIFFSPSDKNRFGVPKEEFLRKVKKKKYDVALDLNCDFELASAYICKASNAAHRIGFFHQHAQTFYNIFFTASQRDKKLNQITYDWLTQSLKMF
ncbi:MAG: hypothetical protein KGZ58_00210 [Ignavibacteriales bacterium]|nr:hypothetical protein [Ignavibacteriales bacterium]